MPTVKFITKYTNDDHRDSLQKLADFLDIDLEYEDLGNGENYFLIKNGKKMHMEVRGNKVDGGYMNARIIS